MPAGASINGSNAVPRKRQKSIRCTSCGVSFGTDRRRTDPIPPERRVSVPFTSHVVLWCPHCGEVNGWSTRGRKNELPALKAYALHVAKNFVKDDEMDGLGYCRCVTCGRTLWRDELALNAGHCVPNLGSGNPWYYDRRCIHTQCASCNAWHSGRQREYKEWMVEKYGTELFEEIVASKAGHYDPLTAGVLREIIRFYEEGTPWMCDAPRAYYYGR